MTRPMRSSFVDPLGLPQDTDRSQEAPAERRALRLAIVGHDAQPVLLWAGGLVLIVSLASFAIDHTGGFQTHVFDIAVAVMFVIVGLALPRLALPDAAYPWLLAAMLTLLALALLLEEWQSPSAVAMAYILLLMVAFGPSILDWAPFWVASAIILVAFALTAARWAGQITLDWTVAGVAAILLGAMLMRIRIRSVNAVADATSRARQLATTDALTGLLNRRGLQMQLPSLTANARRAGMPIFVAFVDIDGLKAANDQHGHEFGDQVIRTVAQATLSAVREGDLVARWGGDELLVAGVGAEPPDTEFSARLHRNIDNSGLDLKAWPGTVSIGMATADAPTADIDTLIRAADEAMYRRRHQTR